MNDIATLNDTFRKTFTGGQVLLTAGIDSMSMDDKAISNCQLNGSKLEYTINAPFDWLINNSYKEWSTIAIQHLDDFEKMENLIHIENI